MKLIHEMIDANKIFIGRQDELSMMHSQLQEHADNWRILHFHGTSGMGKTVLLHQFAREVSHIPSIYLEGKHTYFSVDCFVSRLDKALRKYEHSIDGHTNHLIDQIFSLTKQHGHLVLLLDDFEPSKEWIRWFTQEFIAKLPVHVHIFSAARSPLFFYQFEFGWQKIVTNIELKPFSNDDLHQIANAFGIRDKRLINQVETISQGIPLAVTMTCCWLHSNNIQKPINHIEKRNLIEAFDRHLLDVNQFSGMNKTLLAIASLTYTFDQEMLAYMLGEPIPPDEFTALCESPFVEPWKNGGWMVVSGVRKWARLLIEERLPDTYEQYIRRAEEILDQRLQSRQTQDPNLYLDYAIGKYMLSGNEYTQQVVYTKGRQQLRVRSTQFEELPEVAELYRNNITNYSPYKIDDSHQEQYLEAVWKIDPTAIQIIESSSGRKYFFARMRLNDAIQKLFKKNPMTKKWIESGVHSKDDWFYWINTSRPPMDWDLIDYFLRNIFMPDLPGRKVTCLLWNDYQTQFLKLLGFKHEQHVDYETPNGLKYVFYSLDSRPAMKRNMRFTMLKGDIEEEWIDLTKKLLNDYRHLHHHPSLLKQLSSLSGSHLSQQKLIERFYMICQQHIQSLKKGTKQQQLQAKIFQHAYLKERMSHEVVAELLDIPTSSYYRHLKKLVTQLARYLKESFEESVFDHTLSL